MKSPFIAYAVLISVYILSVILGGEQGVWLPTLAAVIGVTIGMTFGTIGIVGISVVFVFLSFLLPIAILYLMGIHSGLDSPLEQIFENYDWLRTVIPWAAALTTHQITSWFKNRNQSAHRRTEF